jgi:hypothetical protein
MEFRRFYTCQSGSPNNHAFQSPIGQSFDLIINGPGQKEKAYGWKKRFFGNVLLS